MKRALLKAKSAALEVQVRQMAVLGATTVRNRALVDAHKAGHSFAEIASVVELTPARVGQIVSEESEEVE